ncbi:MAG: PilZ domain-containing protein [Nitrospirota bacterium]
MEKRRYERKPANYDIEYSVVVMNIRELKRITARGIIVDTSLGGFGLKTDYLLERGHVVTLKDMDIPEILKYHGIVRWSNKINGSYRAGLSYKYEI